MHHLRVHHMKKAVRPGVFAILVVTLHSTHALEAVLFADALYWLHHHVKQAFEAKPVRRAAAALHDRAHRGITRGI